MSKHPFLCAAWLCVALAPVATVQAQTQATANAAAAKPAPVALPEAGGVVTSQPLTQFGHWFHAGFTQHWNARSTVEAYQLLVRERLLPRGGTEVLVYSGDSVVYRAALPRNLLQILALSETAVETAYQNAVELGLQALLFRDADMSLSGL